MAITEFNCFLNNIEDLEEAYFLDQAIRSESEVGYYNCIRSGNQLIVSSNLWADSLCLASDAAKKSFLDRLQERWAIDKGWSIEASYDFKRANEKDD
ncbi:hypothetical protein E4T81_14130 [Barnesiella sp. WM24]|uniref:hypothetical protein n=1 Tax=Barnesiella sp. WM24 TaxID=2558278 RepID=UPI001071F4C5|nr:hypothetical protein [Barnesiella sp. WM24]TFU91913.1 hypothetical protein E4T81_14130 [Barnesiella sp. WM24]